MKMPLPKPLKQGETPESRVLSERGIMEGLPEKPEWTCAFCGHVNDNKTMCYLCKADKWEEHK